MNKASDILLKAVDEYIRYRTNGKFEELVRARQIAQKLLEEEGKNKELGPRLRAALGNKNG